MDIAHEVNWARKLPKEEAGFLEKNSTRMWRQRAQGWLAVISSLENLFIPSQFHLLIPFLFPCDSPYTVGPHLPPSHPDKHQCVISNTIPLHTPFVSLRLTRRVLQLEHVLEGVVSKVDAMGSKLKMPESKEDLAPSPGMVSTLPRAGSSEFFTDGIHLISQLEKTF